MAGSRFRYFIVKSGLERRANYNVRVEKQTAATAAVLTSASKLSHYPACYRKRFCNRLFTP
jgi:hypothetical protein